MPLTDFSLHQLRTAFTPNFPLSLSAFIILSLTQTPKADKHHLRQRRPHIHQCHGIREPNSGPPSQFSPDQAGQESRRDAGETSRHSGCWLADHSKVPGHSNASVACCRAGRAVTPSASGSGGRGRAVAAVPTDRLRRCRPPIMS